MFSRATAEADVTTKAPTDLWGAPSGANAGFSNDQVKSQSSIFRAALISLVRAVANFGETERPSSSLNSGRLSSMMPISAARRTRNSSREIVTQSGRGVWLFRTSKVNAICFI